MGTSPSIAKNAVKRCLWEIACPSPSDKLKVEIWKHFDSKCAYCYRTLVREQHEGHIDHLVPVAALGQSSRSDFVLACPSCNGDGKRELDWESFLLETCQGDEGVFVSRRDRIIQWIDSNPGVSRVVSPEMSQAIDKACQEINSTIDKHVKILRGLRKEFGVR